MTIVCINRPNRTKPRKYTCKDFERIFRYVVQTEGEARAKCTAARLSGCDIMFSEQFKQFVEAVGIVTTLVEGIITLLKYLPQLKMLKGIIDKLLGILGVIGILEGMVELINELADVGELSCETQENRCDN